MYIVNLYIVILGVSVVHPENMITYIVQCGYKKEAISHSGWQQDIIEEIIVLHVDGTLERVTLPPRKYIIDSQNIYAEIGPDGKIVRVKVHLVARYTQLFGLDYSYTISFCG